MHSARSSNSNFSANEVEEPVEPWTAAQPQALGICFVRVVLVVSGHRGHRDVELTHQGVARLGSTGH